MAMTLEQLRRITMPAVLPVVPELLVCSMPPDCEFEQFRTQHASIIGAAVPYWAVSWPGGQALARFVLDRPETVAGRCVIDIGSGNGLVASAAMRAGAASVIAVDHDPNALLAAAETASLNALDVSTRLGSLETLTPAPGMVVCAGDLWYERETGKRATTVLIRLAGAGVSVLCGDPGRPGRPRQAVLELARCDVPVSTQFEATPNVETRIFAIEPGNSDHADAILPAHYPNARNEVGRSVALEPSGNYHRDDGLC